MVILGMLVYIQGPQSIPKCTKYSILWKKL